MFSNNDWMKVQYRKLKAAHQCVKCKKPLADDWPYVLCPECQAARRAYYKAYRELCRRLGRCTCCGRPLKDKRFTICEICREKDRVRTQKRRAKV